MKILILGGGNMGFTYAQSFLKARVASESDLMILEKTEERVAFLRQQRAGTVYQQAKDCVAQADLLILAVKPQDIDALFPLIRPHLDPQQVFLSIMAGVTLQTITEGLGATKVIRAMPNLPAQIGMGMTAFTSSPDVTRIELVTVQNLLNTTGKAIYVEHEALIDAATAISGSGPAYVYYFMDAMIAAAKTMGFNDSESELLVQQTFMGAIHLQNRHHLSCQEWIQKVASRGGTTEAALRRLGELAVHDAIQQGAQAAHRRAVELGKRAG